MRVRDELCPHDDSGQQVGEAERGRALDAPDDYCRYGQAEGDVDAVKDEDRRLRILPSLF